jgi:hypothetical protein
MTVHALKDNDVPLLRMETGLVMGRRTKFLQMVDASAVFDANLDSKTLPEDKWTIDTAEVLAEHLKELPEGTVTDVLASVNAQINPRYAA